jgi:curved DNA-binding protein
VAEDHRKDLYGTLGVAKGADEDTIRKAYRKLARRYHPDVNPDDDAAEDRFKEISEAYAVLSDAERRRAYDEFGQTSLDSSFDAERARRARDAFGGGGPGAEGFASGGLDDLFSNLFSRRGWSGGPQRRRGPDLEANLELDFVDAARGTEQRLSIARPTATGGLREETVTVRIPPGVADGGRIRLRGKGGEGAGGAPPGDLHARIHVRPHRFFRRDGRDLLIDVPVGVREAILGAKVEVPTLDGRVTVTIPPGTDGGTKLRLRGKGVADPAGGSPGDLYVVVQIRVPSDLDDASKEKLAAVDGLEQKGLRSHLDEFEPG